MVVIKIPIVARINGDEPPKLAKHSDFMNSVTWGGNLSKWARTLFFNIKPLNDLVVSSMNTWRSGFICQLLNKGCI